MDQPTIPIRVQVAEERVKRPEVEHLSQSERPTIERSVEREKVQVERPEKERVERVAPIDREQNRTLTSTSPKGPRQGNKEYNNTLTDAPPITTNGVVEALNQLNTTLTDTTSLLRELANRSQADSNTQVIYQKESAGMQNSPSSSRVTGSFFGRED